MTELEHYRERILSLETQLAKARLQLAAFAEHPEDHEIMECKCGAWELVNGNHARYKGGTPLLYCKGECYEQMCKECAVKEGWNIHTETCPGCVLSNE